MRSGSVGHPQDTRKILRVLAKRAGVKGRIWPHLLRHSLATAMLDRGALPQTIQAVLGHTFISTTMEYYLHPSKRGVRADYHRCVPSFI
jgi:site-specific recombinase XerD